MGHGAHQHGILMHLHASELLVPQYFTDGSPLHVTAPLPSHMVLTARAVFAVHDAASDAGVAPVLLAMHNAAQRRCGESAHAASGRRAEAAKPTRRRAETE